MIVKTNQLLKTKHSKLERIISKLRTKKSDFFFNIKKIKISNFVIMEKKLISSPPCLNYYPSQTWNMPIFNPAEDQFHQFKEKIIQSQDLSTYGAYREHHLQQYLYYQQKYGFTEDFDTMMNKAENLLNNAIYFHSISLFDLLSDKIISHILTTKNLDDLDPETKFTRIFSLLKDKNKLIVAILLGNVVIFKCSYDFSLNEQLFEKNSHFIGDNNSIIIITVDNKSIDKPKGTLALYNFNVKNLSNNLKPKDYFNIEDLDEVFSLCYEYRIDLVNEECSNLVQDTCRIEFNKDSAIQGEMQIIFQTTKPTIEERQALPDENFIDIIYVATQGKWGDSLIFIANKTIQTKLGRYQGYLAVKVKIPPEAYSLDTWKNKEKSFLTKIGESKDLNQNIKVILGGWRAKKAKLIGLSNDMYAIFAFNGSKLNLFHFENDRFELAPFDLSQYGEKENVYFKCFTSNKMIYVHCQASGGFYTFDQNLNLVKKIRISKEIFIYNDGKTLHFFKRDRNDDNILWYQDMKAKDFMAEKLQDHSNFKRLTDYWHIPRSGKLQAFFCSYNVILLANRIQDRIYFKLYNHNRDEKKDRQHVMDRFYLNVEGNCLIRYDDKKIMVKSNRKSYLINLEARNHRYYG